MEESDGELLSIDMLWNNRLVASPRPAEATVTADDDGIVVNASVVNDAETTTNAAIAAGVKSLLIVVLGE